MQLRLDDYSASSAHDPDARWLPLMWLSLILLCALAALLLSFAWTQARDAKELGDRRLQEAGERWAEEIAAGRDAQQVVLDALVQDQQALLAELGGSRASSVHRDRLSERIGERLPGACGWTLRGESDAGSMRVPLDGAGRSFCRSEPLRQGYTLSAAVPPPGRLVVEFDAAVLLEPLVGRSPTPVTAYLALREPAGVELAAVWPGPREPAEAHAGLLRSIALAVPVEGTRWQLALERPEAAGSKLRGWQFPAVGALLLALAVLVAVAVRRGWDEWKGRVRAEERAGERGRRLAAILDNSNALVSVKARDGRYQLVNRAFEEFLGCPQERVLGRCDTDLFSEDTAAALRRGDEHFWQQSNAWCSEEVLTHQGLTSTFRWVRFPIQGQDGEVAALGCFATDVSADRRMEAALRDSEVRYRAIFDQASDGILLVGPEDGAVVDFNDFAHDFLGYSAAEFEGLHISDLERPEIEGETLLGANPLALDRWSYETRFSTRSGELRQVMISACYVDIAQRRQVLAFVRDIGDRKRAELSLNMLSGALDQSGSVVVISDRRDQIEYVNRRFSEVTGYSREEAVGHPAKMLRSPETPESLVAEIRSAGRQGREWRGELLNRRRSGERYWALVSISPVKDERDEITHFVAVGDDVTDIKETQFQMERLAFYDTLTGLANRQLFRERLEQALRVSDRTHRPAALLYLDLDRFKRVNDTLGHDAGDALLNAVGERLGKCVRKEDSVARLGGDEFTVLLAEVDGPSGAAVVARKIIDALSESVRVASQEVFVSASIGITMIPQDGVDSAVLIKNADLAMYRAKDQGRNNYQFFRKEMNDQAAERLMLENDLRRAMYRNELVLHYQPLMSDREDKCVALEALLRWRHPQRGLVGPEVFISVAEESGLLVPMGQWVLRTACSQVKTLQDAGYPDLGVCVNLSARQFRDPNLVGSVQATLTGTGLEARYLHLEITETMLMENLEDAINTVWELKELGAAVSIDDFGAGYSSLSYLKRLPVDRLKVDRSFVSDIPGDEDAMAITAAVIAMAHKLQLTVVAEGVETAEQLSFLKDNHCDYFQGHLFSEPMPGEEVGRFLSRP